MLDKVFKFMSGDEYLAPWPVVRWVEKSNSTKFGVSFEQ